MFVEINGISVYVELSGLRGRPTLLIVSGTGADLRTDVDQSGDRVTHPAVHAGMRVVRYDQRGLGQTSKPDEPYSMADYADDAAALLRWLIQADEIADAPAHVVGISFGGMVAQHLAIRHPSAVNRLVLCCTSSGGVGGSSYDLLSLEQLPPADRARVAATISDTRNNPTGNPPTYAPGAAGAAARTAIATRLRAEDPRGVMGFRRQLDARATHDTWNDLPSIKARTLICGGVYDAQAPPENSQALARRIPNASLEMFDGGHGFLYQDPHAWQAVLLFLHAGT